MVVVAGRGEERATTCQNARDAHVRWPAALRFCVTLYAQGGRDEQSHPLRPRGKRWAVYIVSFAKKKNIHILSV